MTPRNVRLNNPGNIRITNPPTQWVGLAPVAADDEYVTFAAPQYGFRAMRRILRHYELDHVRQSVLGIISRWAPSEENDTDSYVRDVAQHLGVKADALLTPAQRGVPLLRAVAIHEGGCPWPDAVIQMGIDLDLHA